MSAIRKLGLAPVYIDARGELVVDDRNIRRMPANNREDDFGDDDFGDDDLGDDFDGDDAGEDEGDDFGRRRHHGRGQGHEMRMLRKLQRRTSKYGASKDLYKRWAKTIVAGSSTLGAAGTTTVQIRLQFDFRGQDITFTGSVAGSLITQVRFGDRIVFDVSAGVDVAVFAATGFIRGLIKDQTLRAGLDILVTGTLPGAGDLRVSAFGWKPTMDYCE